MDLDEGKRHRTKVQLLKSFNHLRHASRQLRLAEEHTDLCKVFNLSASNIHDNILALRQGIEETQKFISVAIQAIEFEMTEPSAKAPPIRGAFLELKLTPRQKMMRNAGIVFPANLPKRYNPYVTISVIPEVIPFKLKPRKKQKPRTRKKEGIIPI